jgi:hypothetical protein
MASAGFVWIQTAEIRQFYIMPLVLDGHDGWRLPPRPVGSTYLSGLVQRNISPPHGGPAGDLDFHVSFGLSKSEREGKGTRGGARA